MNVAVLAFAPGALIAVGVLLLVLRSRPASLRTADVLARLEPATDDPFRLAPAGPELGEGTVLRRVGSWVASRVPALPGFIPPIKSLELLEIPVADYFARKVLLTAIGVLSPAILAGLMTAILGSPVIVPLLLAPVAGVVGWVTPDFQVRAMATARRRAFTRFVTTYLELVAVALLGATTADAALAAAAEVSDSWVFVRIRREYRIADAMRITKWQALETLADTVEVPALAEMARMMRLSEAQISIRDQLRAACAMLRGQVTTDDAIEAERVTTLMQGPIVATILPVLALVLIPTALQLLGAA